MKEHELYDVDMKNAISNLSKDLLRRNEQTNKKRIKEIRQSIIMIIQEETQFNPEY